MKHLLVVRLSALGDVAILAPVLKARALANPNIFFTLAAPPLLQPIFSGIANIRFLPVNKKEGTRAIYRQLRTVDADAIADLHVVNRVGRALLLLQLDRLIHLKAPLPVQHLNKGRLSRWLFIHHINRKPRRPQWQRYDDVFEKLGTQAFKHSSIQTITQSPNHSITQTIGIAPFSQHKGKNWPLENIDRLVQLLDDKGYNILLFGSKDEAPQLEAIAARHPNAQSLAGRHTFAEELDIIRNLLLMVSMDSSNMHFASALGTPVISIWGATHPDFGFYGYQQPRNLALCANLPCQPCSAFGQKPCRHRDYRCLTAITPEQVMHKISELGKICNIDGKIPNNNT